MDNQYQMLKKENQIRSKCMSPVSQEAYREAIRYFKRSNRHPYDTQLMYKELIGIGLAADARGENLVLALGENPKEFYEGLVENARPSTLWSILSLWLLPFSFGFYAVFELLIFFLLPKLNPVPFTLFNLICLLIGSLCIALITAWEQHRNIRSSRKSQPIYLIVFAGVMYLELQLMKQLPKITIFALPAWLGAIGCAAMWYGSCRYRDWCYAKLAKEKPWQG